jgi:hypothetical protein
LSTHLLLLNVDLLVRLRKGVKAAMNIHKHDRRPSIRPPIVTVGGGGPAIGKYSYYFHLQISFSFCAHLILLAVDLLIRLRQGVKAATDMADLTDIPQKSPQL